MIVDCHQSLDVDNSEPMPFSVHSDMPYLGVPFGEHRPPFAHNTVVLQMKPHSGLSPLPQFCLNILKEHQILVQAGIFLSPALSSTVLYSGTSITDKSVLSIIWRYPLLRVQCLAPTYRVSLLWVCMIDIQLRFPCMHTLYIHLTIHMQIHIDRKETDRK